jgi:methylated-DNA-[protein]-cysteine S-methyltransferase
MIHVETVESPIEPLTLALWDEVLVAVEFDKGPERRLSWVKRHFAGEDLVERAPESEAAKALAAYFVDPATDFSGLVLKLHGTDFQVQVWETLRRIPLGETVAYGTIARLVGQPEASQAVGRANGDNPIPVIVPCHRVIGMDGSLTGFGGGLERKVWLLDHESGGRLI